MGQDEFFIIVIKYAQICLQDIVKRLDIALDQKIEHNIIYAKRNLFAVAFIKKEVEESNKVHINTQKIPWHNFGQCHVKGKLKKLTNSHPLELELPDHHGATPFVRFGYRGIDFATYKKVMQKKFLLTREGVD